MSTPDISKVLRLPGRLSHTPTSLATAYPHGGTALGTVGSLDLVPRETPFAVTAEEWGGTPSEFVSGGTIWLLEAKLREFDADALSILFPGYASGARGGPTLQIRAATNASRAGQNLGALLSRVLVFTPDAVDDFPLVIFRRAVPAIAESAKLAFRGNEAGTIACCWYATPDSNAKIADVGRRRDLTL
jgi:hypothetical protein